MWTAASVRREIYNFIGDKPFSIRDFLNFGPRAAVDQVFYRMVKAGIIIRIARGLYIKDGAPTPSVHEVATLKAKTFNKTIAIHGSEAAQALGIDAPAQGLRPASDMREVVETLKRNAEVNPEPIYAVSGRSSTFRYGDKVIRFIGTSSKQMALADDPVGLVIRALAYVGKEICDAYIVSCAVRGFNWTERDKRRESRQYMYAWMDKCFNDIIKTYKRKQAFA